MPSLREEFSDFEKTRGPITAIAVFSESSWGDYRMERWQELGLLPYRGSLADCPDVILDMEYEDGFGAPDVPDYECWSDDWVGFCHEYDGSTSTETVRRNPPTNERKP